MACFADSNVSQGSVATYARCGGIINNLYTSMQIYPEIFQSFFLNRLRYDRSTVMSFLAHPVGNIYDGAWRKRCVAYHDDGEGHGQPRDAGEERRGSYESHRARVHPLPERIGRHSAVDVDEHAPDRSTVQTADKPASQHSPSPAAPPRRAGRRYFALWSFHT